MRYRITVSYDGAGFCGWQSQPSGRSVQDALENAVFRLSGERTHVVGSGRTDAGVHAIAQVAHFELSREYENKTIVGALNAHLPRSVRVTDCRRADGGFDARKSAKRKTYMYLMYRGERSPLLDGRAVAVGDADCESMRRIAEDIVGTHDFTTFMAHGSGAKNAVRTVYSVRFEDDGKFIKMFITANGFLYNMVRIIAALMIKAGHGEPVDIKALLAARDRTAAKDTAPPYGLYLYDVEYE